MDINTSQNKAYQKPIVVYNGSHWLINELKTLIDSKYNSLFHAVIVHGSFATDELIKFSDFDGLLIVKDELLSSSLFEQFIKESMRLIYKFDPLQHHGWFQLSKSDLNTYPQQYLPHEILDNSKLIFPSDSDFKIDFSFDNSNIDYQAGLNHIIGLLEIQMKLNWSNERIYMLKSYLSKVMLLPSLYFSCKYSKGVFKKDSFDLVKPDFTDKEWHVIVMASAYRTEWDYNSNSIQRKLMSRSDKIFRKLTKYWLAPRVKSPIAKELNSEFKTSLDIFIKAIKRKL